MSNFISNLMMRHTGTGINIEPRVKGRFESDHHIYNAPGPDMVNEPVSGLAGRDRSSLTQVEVQNREKTIFPQNITDDQDFDHGKSNITEDITPEPVKTEVKKTEPDITPARKRNKPSGPDVIEDPTIKKPDSHTEYKSTIEDIKITRKRITIQPEIKTNIITRRQPRKEEYSNNDKSEPVKKTIDVPKSAGEKITTKQELKKPDIKEALTPGQFIDKIKLNQPGQLVPPANITNIFQSKMNPAEQERSTVNGRPSAEETTVKVSIGRIEIKAVNQQPVEKKIKRSPAPIMTLEEYLNKQSKKQK